MKSQINKSKGFTLIELLVVIAIISLLSAIVLASIKSAREKAQITKTVAEMKSLQTALELYKNQFGRYPGEDGILGNYDDDDGYFHLQGLYWPLDSIETFLTTELVNRKMLNKVPHAPNYPNNCTSYDQCSTSGYILGYSATESLLYGYNYKDTVNYSDYVTCGGNRVKNYVIYFYANNKVLKLPKLGVYYDDVPYDILDWMGFASGNVYCMAI